MDKKRNCEQAVVCAGMRKASMISMFPVYINKVAGERELPYEKWWCRDELGLGMERRGGVEGRVKFSPWECRCYPSDVNGISLALDSGS